MFQLDHEGGASRLLFVRPVRAYLLEDERLLLALQGELAEWHLELGLYFGFRLEFTLFCNLDRETRGTDCSEIWWYFGRQPRAH